MPSAPLNPSEDKSSSGRIFALVLTSVFFGLVLTGILHHEPWGDELQAWLIARDSVSVPNLLYNLRYEAHPPLWHLVLFLISRFTADPLYMQLAHLCIATAAAYIFARFSPFSKLQKCLFLAGYFPLYEYAVKSRCYALGILLFFSYCALFPKRDRHPVLMPLLLFLSALTSVMGVFVSLGLWPPLLFEAFRRRKTASSDFMIGLCFFLLTCIWTFNTVNVPADAYYPSSPSFLGEPLLWRLRFALNPGHYDTFLPLRPSMAVFNALPFVYLFELLLVSLALLRRRMVLFAYLASSCVLLLFFSIHAISLWHRGHLFLALIIALWLAPRYLETDLKSRRLSAVSDLAGRLLGIWLTLLLALQVPAAARNLYKDVRYSFSGLRGAAEFVNKNGLDALPMVGDDDSKVSGITAYLRKPVFFPRRGKTGTFVTWNRERGREVDQADLLAVTGRIAADNRSDVLLILNYPLAPITAGTELLAAFPGYADYAENCYLYRFLYVGTGRGGLKAAR